MAHYPIIENTALLGSSIDLLVAKMVDNLTAKGVAVHTGMTLTQLIDKIVEVKYQPLPLSRRTSRGIVPDLNATLTNLDALLYEAHVRFRLKLEICGITGLSDSMTFNQYADKIVDISSKPQYELHPKTLSLGATGHFVEFYFNTSDALKVDFSIDSSEFTLDRTTGKGPANFIIRVTGQNNTTALAKSAVITVTLDNGKYPSETIPVTQAAGVYTYGLEDAYWVAYDGTTARTTVPARGELSNENNYINSVIFARAYFRSYWNGILSTEVPVGNMNPVSYVAPFKALVANGDVTYWNHVAADPNNSTSGISRQMTFLYDHPGHDRRTITLTAVQDAGSVSYAYTEVQHDGLSFNAAGQNKVHLDWNRTSFGATLKTYWNGRLTNEEYYNNSSPYHNIEMTNNGGGFYVADRNLYQSNRTTEVGPLRSCSVRCVYSEAGKGIFYSEYVTVSQDANTWYDKRLELAPTAASIPSVGGSVALSTAIYRGYASGAESFAGNGYGSLVGSAVGFSVSGLIVSASRSYERERSISVYATYSGLVSNSAVVSQGFLPKIHCKIGSTMNPGQYSSTADVWSYPSAPDTVRVDYSYSCNTLHGEESGSGSVDVSGDARSNIYFDGDLFYFVITGVRPSETENASYSYY